MSTNSIATPVAAERGHLWRDTLSEFWRYRELLYFFAWRDIKVRYRQAALGAAWAVIQPLFNMLIFAVVFGRLAKMPSNGIPYPIFSYVALVPWTYFSGVIGLASISLISNSSLITKVYFPRMLLPAGTAVAGLLDFVIASVLLVGMMFYYHVRVGWFFLLSPVVIFLMVVLTTGVSMLLAAMTVKYRDIKYVLPFAIQLLLFATPIIYPVDIFPVWSRPILALNPCWGMVVGFRTCLLPHQTADLTQMGISTGMTIVIFAFGLYYFNKSEK